MTTTVLPALHVGRATAIGALTVFPLWTDAPAPDGLTFGTGADVEVTETGSVENLTVLNLSPKPLLLIEGELLEGGWQHRVVDHDIVLAADGNPTPVDVRCVEAHRWHGEGGHVRGGRRASPSVRAVLTGMTAEWTQAEVWNRVANYETVYGSSPTSSYLDFLDGRDETSDPPSYSPLPGQRGVLIGASGFPVLAELFPSTEALEAQIDALLRSVLFDAGTLACKAQPVPGRRARRMTARVDALSAGRCPDRNAGLAIAHVGESAELVMRGTTFDERWAHLTVFDRRHPLVRLTVSTIE